jgi:hypothetical protein
MISPTFCAAPWTVHCVNADGTAGVCCVNNTVLQSAVDHDIMISSHSIQQMKSDMLAGRPAQGCEKCYDHEAAGIYSLRHHYNDSTGPMLDIARLSDDVYENRTWYDLSLGNKCNQKCRICGPYNSTAWAKDAKSLTDLSWTHVNWRELDSISIDSSVAIPGILDSMRAAKDKFIIELKGGEPLYMESSRKLISEMIRLGLHEHTAELRIITNGTQHDQTLLSMLEAFPAIDLALSIDATGLLHAYTRGTNLSWDECRRSWNQLAGLGNLKKLRISNTIYAYTLWDLAKLHSWARSEFGRETRMVDAPLHKPRYLHPMIVPQELREKAVQSLEDEVPMKSILADDYVQGELGPLSLSQLRDQFKAYTQRLDQLRGESLVDLVPELAELL